MQKFSDKLIKDCKNYILSVAKQNRKSATGTFVVSGYNHLWFFRKMYVDIFVRRDKPVTLVPCPENRYDREAIKVIYKNKFIGWVSKDYNNKKRLFCYLILGKSLTSHVNFIGDTYDGKFKQIEISFKVELPDKA